jgi:hypothetical protein
MGFALDHLLVCFSANMGNVMWAWEVFYCEVKLL